MDAHICGQHPLLSAPFLDYLGTAGASGIVNRGCHNPPNCNTGELHAGTERAANFEKLSPTLVGLSSYTLCQLDRRCKHATLVGPIDCVILWTA